MDTKMLVLEYLPTREVMQLATVSAGQPWLCTVHFAHDDQLNMYWISLPSRRHSLELAADSRVAVAVVVKQDLPVIGIQAEGSAEAVTDPDVVKKIMDVYIAKHGTGAEFYDKFVAGTNVGKLYKFTPSSAVLFDEVNFPGNGRQVVQLQ